MGSRKKRSLDGLSEESGRYAVPAHKNEILTTVAVGVDSGVNVNTDSNIRFQRKIEPDRLGR